MKSPIFLGVFEREEDVLAATRATRERGYSIHDVYTPYAVHGLDEAMGLRASRLTYVCFAFAAFGLMLAIFSQFWIGAIDWPLNVGGKPFNSLPAYLPVAFELTVLIGGLGVVLALLIRTRLYPGRRVRIIHPRVTDDRFVIALERTDSSFDREAVIRLWEEYRLIRAGDYEGVKP